MAAAKSRKSTTNRQQPATATAATVGTGTSSDRMGAESAVDRGSAVGWRVASCLIALQLGLLLFSILANLTPSLLQERLLAVTGPYRVTTAQDYGAVPIELTHGEVLEVPLRIDVHRAGEATDRWITLFPAPGKAASQWPNASRLLRLIAADIPDSEILAEFAARAIEIGSPRNVQDADYVRIVAPYMASFDEFGISGEGSSENVRRIFPESRVFSAQILRPADGNLLLLPDQDPSRTSKAEPRLAASVGSSSGVLQ